MAKICRHLAICALVAAACLPLVVSAAPQFEINTGAYSRLNDAITGPKPIVVTEDKEPLYVLTRFVVEGVSGEDWVEALEILNTMRDREPGTPALWYERFMANGEEHCPSQWSKIAESADSITFERKSGDCPPFEAQHAIYKVMYGKEQVFTLTATRKGEMDEDMRKGWLDVMDSASVTD